METVIGAEEIDEAKFDVPVVRTSSTPSSPREIADPVVYKLVRDSVDHHKILPRKISVEVGQRVDGDGRLVPATDDEVMEVEDLLEDDKSEMHPVPDTRHPVGCTSTDVFVSSKTQFNGSGQSENPEVEVEKSDVLHDAEIGLGKLNAEPEETVPLLSTNSSDSHIDQPGNDGEFSDPVDGTTKSVSVSVVCSSSKPDFSKLEGEICLDNLSVRELHETFKATFGRETSVKDKQWLKRRIAMGLTNSCDVTTTTFVIKDNKVVKKGKEESFKTVDDTLAMVPIVGEVKENSGGLPDGCSNQIEIPQSVSGKRLGNPCLEYDCDVEDLHGEQRAAKRVRKPTRRYIEELSEVETREYSGKLISSVKNSGHGQLSPRSRLRPGRDAQSNGRSLVTRQDSLGGWGFQVPYVCRVRRSRPRENFMALMKLQPSNMGVAAKLVKKALSARGARSDGDMENKVVKARSASQWIQEPLVAEFEREKNYQVRITSELEKDVKLKRMDSSGDYSDDYVATVPTAKGGMRRKHHRPWTLSEVVKLVEGVARYGAGRWSEIKRLAFASYSHRTSVDLKDKWRNLLRASFAQSPPEKGMQSSRKHASVPIPAPILLRVKELAELQAQVPPNLSSSSKLAAAACSGRDVHETRSGYL